MSHTLHLSAHIVGDAVAVYCACYDLDVEVVAVEQERAHYIVIQSLIVQ